MNYDQLAARILLSGASEASKQARLSSLCRSASIASGSECPECGSRDAEDNGGSEYRCVACDHRWGSEGGESYGC